MNLKYIVVGNVGAHNGWIESVDYADIWTNDNPGGWTYQDLTGSHGTVLGEFDTRQEAKECLDQFLDCPSSRAGCYCYTHNQYVGR